MPRLELPFFAPDRGTGLQETEKGESNEIGKDISCNGTDRRNRW